MPTLQKDDPGERQGIQSLEIGVRLFEELYKLQRPATLSELAKLSRMPPAKAHRYCVSLVRTGLMQQNGRGLYGVGSFGLRILRPTAALERARNLAANALPDLVHEIGETTFVSAWGRTGPFIMNVQDSPKPISIRPNWPGDLPLYNSSTGRIFAAFLPPERLEPLIAAELDRQRIAENLGVKAIGERRAAFHRLLAEARRRKLSRTTGERYPGVVSFSAPIFDRDGTVLVALTSFGLASTLSSSWQGPVPTALDALARSLTERLRSAF